MSRCSPRQDWCGWWRTRRVRAIEERFYGRTARMFYVAVERSTEGDGAASRFQRFRSCRGRVGRGVSGRKVVGFHPTCPHLGGTASEFWERMAALVTEFDQLPRRARPCMDSRSASIRPTIQPFRAATPKRTRPWPRRGGATRPIAVSTIAGVGERLQRPPTRAVGGRLGAPMDRRLSAACQMDVRS